MKKLLISSVLVLGMVSAVLADPGMPPSPTDSETEAGFKKHHEHKMAMMAQELGLTAEQKAKVDAIFEEQRIKFKAVHDETQTRLQAVLTPEQLKKLQEMHPLRHRLPPPGQMPPPPPPQKTAE